MWNIQRNGTLNRADFTGSIWSCKCQSVFCFNEQPRQTDDPDSGASFPFSENDMQSDTSEWKGHYVASLSRRGFGRSAHLSAIRDEAQGRWSVASFGSGCVWFGQIVRRWGHTFMCLLLMDPPAFFYTASSHSLPSSQRDAAQTGREWLTRPVGSVERERSSLHLLQVSKCFCHSSNGALKEKRCPSCKNFMSPSEEGLVESIRFPSNAPFIAQTSCNFLHLGAQ